MVSRFRLCSPIQSASASASATVVMASTSTASCSPKINVDVAGSKPSGSPKGFGRSPTIGFPGAVKTFTLSVLDVMGAVMCVVSLSSCDTPFYAASRPGQALTVREVGALSDFDDVTVRIADVAAYLAVLGNRLGDELGP